MRGAANTVLWIVLGLIVLGVILFSAVGPMGLKKFANEAMESMFGVKEFFGVEGTTESIAAPPPLARRNLVLDSNSVVAARQIAEAVIRCHNRVVMEKSYLKTDCYYVNFTNRPVVFKDDVMNILSTYSVTGDEDSEPYALLSKPCAYEWERGWCVPNVLTVFDEGFVISGSYASVAGLIDLLLAYEGPVIRRTVLSRDHDVAVSQLAAALARCWFYGDYLGREGHCEVFDASQLTAPVTKGEVLASISAYLDEYPVERLEKWWNPDDDWGEMELTITSRTPGFYACVSDTRNDFSPRDLCLTHDLRNDCCT